MSDEHRGLFGQPTLVGNLTQKDAILKREEWKEVAKLHGMPGVTYTYIEEDTKEFTIHGELKAKYSEPIPIPMIWMEVPDQESAMDLGWVSELPGDKPYLCQLPYDTPHLQRGCRLYIPFVGDSLVDDETGEPQCFRITRVYMLSRFPTCRMCQLAPEFKSALVVDVVDKFDDRNYGFLKVDQNS